MKAYNKISFLLVLTVVAHVSSLAMSQGEGTIQAALLNVRKMAREFPIQDPATVSLYEKKHISVLAQCAKILCDAASEQVLLALQEIDNRIVYWRDQKNHPWKYFITKNPIKWVTGKSQHEEIKTNLEQLESYQGELYVLLGQLAEHGNVYNHEYKTVFVADHKKAYAWIDALFDLLARIKVTVEHKETMSAFLARVTVLKLKLIKVRRFKNDILAEISESQIPAHLERNWLKYAMLMSIFGQGYKYAEQIGKIATTSFGQATQYAQNVGENIQRLFLPGTLSRQDNIDIVRKTMKDFLDMMESNKIITKDEKNKIITDEAQGSSVEFQKFMNEKIMSSTWYAARYGATAGNIFAQLFTLHEIAGLRNIALLAPAAFAGWAGYRGISNIYQKFVTPNYAPMRYAVVEINSLFVDQTKPLDDERYGKMLYLIYNLKQRAQRDVPIMERADFIDDLHKIESKEFDVAAKRRIVDDMFRKYSFLK